MNINWEMTGNDPNDLTAVIGDDMLRVEKMSDKQYWWCIYHGEDTYDCWHSKIPRPKTLDEAKKQCEDKYLEVLNKANAD